MPCLLPLKPGLALFHEGSHAFFLIVRAEEQVEVLTLDTKAVLQWHLECPEDRVFSKLHGYWSHFSNMRRQLLCLTQITLHGHDPIYETKTLSFSCGESTARQDDFHRYCLTDRARQALGAACAGHYPNVNFGLTELGGLGCDYHVAQHSKLVAATESIAADRGDKRLFEAAYAVPFGELVAGQHFGRCRLGHLLNVRPGSECALVAGYHRAP